MAQPLPRHHAAVLRPHELRALLVLAAVLVALAAAAVVSLIADDEAGAVRSSSPVPERVSDVVVEQPRATIGGKAAPVGR